IGIRLAAELASEGIGLIAVGDMGIGNTTAASAVTAVLTKTPITQVTGRGTGIDGERLQRKIAVIERALDINKPESHDPLDVLSKGGGFEIGGPAGKRLGGAAPRCPTVLGGRLTRGAALAHVGRALS